MINKTFKHGKWYPISKLPPLSWKDQDVRCVVAWIDRENPSDIGIEVIPVELIIAGDYCSDDRMIHVYWKSLGDCPCYNLLKEIEENEKV